MHLRRLRLGEWLAAAAGLVLVGSLFLDWYGTQNAWQSLDVLDIVIFLVALLALALAALQATRTSPAMPAGAGVLTVVFGAIGTLLVVYRIINQPGPNELVEVRTGAWIGLAAAIAITVGGWESIRNERVRDLPPGPEPEVRSAP
jgi:hypothetical protein